MVSSGQMTVEKPSPENDRSCGRGSRGHRRPQVSFKGRNMKMIIKGKGSILQSGTVFSKQLQGGAFYIGSTFLLSVMN